MNTPIPTADGSNTLHSQRYGQTYHSTHGALTEACHVFLEASDAANRLRHLQATRVLEIGFGLGLNLLLTADLAVEHSTPLEYHAFEHDLVSEEVIRSLGYEALLKNTCVLDALCQLISTATPDGSHSCTLSPGVQLTLHLHDATRANIKDLCGVNFHAVYLDAFSPDSNTECWSPPFLQLLADVMASDGRLSTYSAKGSVRRTLQAAGLQVNKLPGPPGKREMLVAHCLKD